MLEDKTLCVLEADGFLKLHLEEYKDLVRDAEQIYVCCGRVARKEDLLCSAERLSRLEDTTHEP
jgi:hypothetical protein